MGIQDMKVNRHIARGFWDQHPPPSTIRCHRRPLAVSSAATHLKSFIRPQNSGPRKPGSPHRDYSSPQLQLQVVEGQSGGTRWNPTQEQIRYLEMLYRGGIRTPTSQQIEHITAHLGKFGKIEGKNVFYWFQNHKARERQKQKRISMAQNNHSANAPMVSSPSPPPCLREVGENGTLPKGKVADEEIRQCTEEEGEEEEEEGGIRTLELFPLHPEGRLD